MKRTVLIILLLPLVFGTLHSQGKSKTRNNIVFFEVFGAAHEGFGMGYERYLPLTEWFRCSLRAGVSHDTDYKYFPPFLGSSFMFGGHHSAEIGFNYMMGYPQTRTIHNPEFNPDGEWPLDDPTFIETVERINTFNPLVGYRYQNRRFMLRGFIALPIHNPEHLFSLPHAGASIGFAF